MTHFIIATLKFSQLNKGLINFLSNNEKIIVRFNGSHINISQLIKNEKILKKINNKILIDLPCNKIRYQTKNKIIKIQKGKTYKLYNNQFNISDILKHIKKRSNIYMNDKLLKFKIIKIDNKYIEIKSFDNGYIYHNRGVVFENISNNLDLFTKKDLELIEYINSSKLVNYAGISFVRNGKDISLSKKIINKKCILKLETPKAYKNIAAFKNHHDFILLDRGDLISFYGIGKIDEILNEIINKLKSSKLIIATQLYYSHLGYNQPSISDLITLRGYCNNKNIKGFQLSEETALSKDPISVLQSFIQTLSYME